MSCLIVRHPETSEITEVHAPNDEPSILYDKIRSSLDESYQPDPYVQSALEKGMIRDLSTPEVAAALWSKAYTPQFKDWFGNWQDGSVSQDALDKNGEPDVVVSPDGSFSFAGNKTYYSLADAPNDLVYDLGPREKQAPSVTEPPRQPMVKRRFTQLQEELRQEDSSLLYDASEHEDGKIKINRVIEKKDVGVHDKVKIQDILDRMQAIFPQLTSQFISENDLAAYNFDGKNPNLQQITGFVQDGVVHLIDGRYSPDTAIEEFLHPFVTALQQDNPELFEKLLAETHNRHSDIVNLVDNIYTPDRGFTSEDRQNEAVTRVLQRGVSERITESPTPQGYNLGSLIKKFFSFLHDIFRKISGKNRLYVGEIPTDSSLDDILSLLDEGLQIDLGPLSKKVYFNLVDEKLDVYNRVLEDANDVQREIVETLAKNNALFFEENHQYVHALTGEEYTSVTQLIKGRVDEDDAYAINRAMGKEFDFIMNSVVLGKPYDEIKQQLKLLKPGVADQFYNYFSIFLSGMRSNGSIVIPQLVLADDQSMVAGTPDLFIIDPEGNLDVVDLKISKNTVLGKGYDKQWPVTEAPSLFVGRSLSTRQQHGIQQAAYKKLIDLMLSSKLDKQVRSIKSLHFKIDIKKDAVTGFEPEGFVDHSTTNYTEETDKLIPTELPRPKAYTTLLQVQALPENAPIIERLQDLITQFQKTIKARHDYFENINAETTGKTTASKEYLQELSELSNRIEDELSKGSPVGAYYHIVKFINQDLKKKTEQISGKNVSQAKLVDFLLETEKDINDYMDLLSTPKLQLNNNTLKKLSREALDYADSLRTAVDVELKEFIKDFVKGNSSRSFTEQELDELLREAKDISQVDYQLGDIATSKDTLLATLDKVYKRKLQEVYDHTDEVASQISQLGRRLAELSGGKPDFDFMLQRGKDGKPTGYYVRKIGSQYWTKLRSVKEKIRDENGQALKYREIYNLNTASKDDIRYNLELMKHKEAFRKFMRAEYVDEHGVLQDGEYHQYSDDFTEARKKHEYLHVEMVDGKVVYSEWRKLKGVTDAEYRRYQAKYYSEEISYLSPVKDAVGKGEYEYNGRVVERSDRFVKSEFVTPREYSASGESMLDPKYERLMNPKTDLEKAQKEFYDAWTKSYESQLDKLPADVRRSMSGRLPLIRDRFTDTIKSKPSGVVKGFVKGLRNLNPFDIKIYSHNMLTNEDGEIENQVPVSYVGDFQNEKAIERLETKIKDLGDQLRNKEISYDEYKEKLKRTKQALSIEKGRFTKDELSTDMVSNLVEFSKMAENYAVMSAFESTVEAIQRTAAERTYTREGSAGVIMSRNTKEPVRFNGNDSLVAKRLEKWKEMVFYRTSNPYHSTIGQVMRKMMSYMSLKNVGLNPFGQVNNYLMGKINNTIENFGGIYWDRKALLRATGQYNSDFLPGLLAHRAAKLLSKGDYYEIDKPYSKYEALASKFRMMRKLESGDLAHGLHDRILDLAYVMQESAEYNIQTKTGMAILMTRTLTHNETGEKTSIYDAYDFDQKTHSLKLKEGYSLPDELRHETTNYIYEVNKQIHGSYAYEDRAVIQQHLLGELAAQFHKWVYPAFKARYKKSYFDENLGEIEGRYYTVWNFMNYAWNLKSLSEGWGMLDERQKGNIYKSAADLAFMLMGFALYHLFVSISNNTDDDDETKKKLLNWLASQSDRIYDEVSTGVFVLGTTQQYQLLKSPIALLGTAKDVLDVVYEAAKAPFPPYDDLRYKTGPHRGELKIKKELMDVIPVMNLMNRWDSYESVKQFYIR